jgi:ABC-type sugar transport system ATPase subunit
MLAGLEPVTSGTIRIGERDVTSLPPGKRDVAMVFQDYALYPHFTARENIALGLKIRRVHKPEIERRVAWAADVLGLTPLLDRRPKAMSGGQRQRVAMGRAMVREPAVFLFDEPLSNLDAKLRGQMRIEIGRLQRRLGTTMLYVTHDQIEALTLADRLVVLDGGRVQQIGRPADVYDAPVNRFVAEFIGSPAMNFVEGELAGDGDELAFVSNGMRVPLPAGRVEGRGTQNRVTLGIRPEDLAVAVDRPDWPQVTGTLSLVERLGAATHLHVEHGGAELVAAVHGTRQLESGSPVAIAVDPGRVHLFDEEGRSLLARA